ncbi:DNA polymerase iota-like [Oculina patagonica]
MEDFRSSYDYSYEEGEFSEDDEEEGLAFRSPSSGCSRQSVINPSKKRRIDTFSPKSNEGTKNSAMQRPMQVDSCIGHSRTIIHIDIDCFYAQVEMIRRPELRHVPLGIQQKHIVVTCNYVARERGVKKLVYVSDAKKKCPDLVLVNGEDLTVYREFSGKVNSLLTLKFTPLVERLGMDENYLDVTELVSSRLLSNPPGDRNYSGFLYNSDTDNTQEKIVSPCPCGCHERLKVGSMIAAEVRQAILQETGLTCCAGIAHSKLLAKLVGGWKKPNMQTTLLPEDAKNLLAELQARDIPGIGHSMAKKLQTINISSVPDLLACSRQVLEKEFGNSVAEMMIKLCHGIDDSNVTPSGEFKSISDEDSFKNCSTLDDARKRLKSLIEGLLPRVSADIGIPQTVRVTVRRHEDKFYKRESRQCGLPHTVSFTDKEKARDMVLAVCLSLFNKVVDVKKPFHLTLLGVSLTNFHKPHTAQSKNISNFFRKSCSKQTDAETFSTGANTLVTPDKVELFDQNAIDNGALNRHDLVNVKDQEPQESLGVTSQATQQNETTIDGTNKRKIGPSVICPNGIDPTVFAELPSEIQRELQASWQQQDKRTVNTDKAATKVKKCSGIQKYFATQSTGKPS